MRLRSLFLCLAPATTVCLATACDDKADDDDDDDDDDTRCLGRSCDDSGGSWDSGSGSGSEHTGDGPHDDDPPDDWVDSCEWVGFDLCIEFTNYDSTAAWCDDIGATYGIDTTFVEAACPGGAIFECDTTSAGGDYPSGPERIITHYYEPGFSESDAERFCADSGGTPA